MVQPLPPAFHFAHLDEPGCAVPAQDVTKIQSGKRAAHMLSLIDIRSNPPCFLARARSNSMACLRASLVLKTANRVCPELMKTSIAVS